MGGCCQGGVGFLIVQSPDVGGRPDQHAGTWTIYEQLGEGAQRVVLLGLSPKHDDTEGHTGVGEVEQVALDVLAGAPARLDLETETGTVASTPGSVLGGVQVQTTSSRPPLTGYSATTWNPNRSPAAISRLVSSLLSSFTDAGSGPRTSVSIPLSGTVRGPAYRSATPEQR
jgi:hypothetical protein